MTPEMFTAYARDRLATAFPEWLAWLSGIYADRPRRAAAVAAYGQRMHAISVDELEHVVCLVLQGRRQRPRPELLIETLASYVERIQQDDAKAERDHAGRIDFSAARHAILDEQAIGISYRQWQPVYSALVRMAESGGGNGVPCYEPTNRIETRDWAIKRAREWGVNPEANIETTASDYAAKVQARGIVVGDAAARVRSVPSGETWVAEELIEQLEGER